ncbi:MAG: glycosyl hydrolase 53 family protein, partial [Bacteroidota bacterium]
VRIRLWHDPDWTNYSNLEDVKISIDRAQQAGMLVMLDFHYSDFWADPGRQWRPTAWEDVQSDEVLGDSVYNYTYSTLLELNAEGLLPEMVQIGNETNGNILLPRNGANIDSGSPNLYPVDWERQVMLLQRGLDAVKSFNEDFGTNVKTIIHIANPIDASSWFTSAFDNGLLDFDIIGLSYYPQWHDLGVREVGEYVADMKNQFSKEVMIVETGYPWTTGNANDNANNVLGFDSRLFTYSNTFSVDIQRDFLIELTWLVKESGGLGVVYWEPAWISTSCQTFWATGSHWDNATLVDFDGKLHSGADFLSYDYSQMPSALEDQQVTFTVDMTAIDIGNGVFVTGDFTGSPWQLLPMNAGQNNLYELQTLIPGRTSGAYIFYNDDSFDDVHRESVPSQCASVWDTHREYRIRDEEAQFYFAWGRCDQQPNEIVLSIEEVFRDAFLYPTITTDLIKIESGRDVLSYDLLDVTGKVLERNIQGTDEMKVTHLRSGLYYLRLNSQAGVTTLRFIKQ